MAVKIADQCEFEIVANEISIWRSMIVIWGGRHIVFNKAHEQCTADYKIKVIEI